MRNVSIDTLLKNVNGEAKHTHTTWKEPMTDGRAGSSHGSRTHRKIGEHYAQGF